MKGKGILAAGIVILAAIAAGALSLWRQGPDRQPQQVKAQAPPPPSEVILPAKLQAVTLIGVAVPVTGRVEAFHAEIGDEVYEGQLLAQVKSEALNTVEESATIDLERVQTRLNNLESSISAARLEASRASADAARVRADYDRVSRLFERERMLLSEGAIPRLRFEKTEKDYIALQAESKNLDEVAKQSEERVEILQRELDNSRKILQDKSDELEMAKSQIAAGDIYSPVGGIVAARRGQPGDRVNPAVQDLFQIATDLSTLEAVAEPSSADLARMKLGLEAFIALAESPNELLPGTIRKIEEGRVVIEFKNPNPAIKPGLTAQVRIKLT